MVKHLERLYSIDKASLDVMHLQHLREALMIQGSQKDYAGNLPPPYPLYEESELSIRGPKFAMRELCGVEDENAEFCGIPISPDVQFTGTLRAERFQPDATSAVLSDLRAHGGAILVLGCGLGKTVNAIYCWIRLGVKALLIAHKVFLLDQWQERLAQFAPNARIGVIRGQEINIDECDIVLATMQSLSQISYDPAMFASFGMVIVDEAHRVCAKTMSRCLPVVASRYMLALSATPQRKDGADAVLYHYFHRVSFERHREHEQANVQLLHMQGGPRKEHWVFLAGGAKRLNFSRMVTELTTSALRNKLIVDVVVQACEEQRKVLLLSDRRAHLENLYQLLQGALAHIRHPMDEAEAEAERAKWAVPELAELTRVPVVDFYVGQRKKEELKRAESADVILATYQMAQEGLDISPPPDTLILSTPKADIVQSVGRVMRDATTEGALPRIIDVVDSWSLFLGLASKRRSLYISRKYNQQHFDFGANGDAQVRAATPQAYAEEDREAQLFYEQQQIAEGNFGDITCPF